MTLDQVSALLQETVRIALMVAAPFLMAALGTGLLVSVFQTATQINEQTLTFVPKIVSMVIAAMIFVPWIATRLLEYTQQMFAMAV